MSKRQLCTFCVENLTFGIDVLHVQEVIRFLDLTEVPLAPKAVVGLINLRGEIVTAIDMRRRLGLDENASDEPPINVVLRQSDSIVSLLVDTIGDVVEVDREGLEPPPETLDPLTRGMVHSVCKLDGQLLLVLDADAIPGPGVQKVS